MSVSLVLHGLYRVRLGLGCRLNFGELSSGFEMHKNVKIVNSRLTKHQREVFDHVVQFCDRAIRLHQVSVRKLGERDRQSDSWLRNKMLVLSGAAGTGKTFVTAKIIKRFAEDYDISVTAPTHKAVRVICQNMEENGLYGIQAGTTQSFLKLRKAENHITGAEYFAASGTDRDVRADLLIVDECSMIGSELFSLLEEIVHREYCKVVLFVGDFNQLPPVGGTRSPVQDLAHIFELKEVVRQARDSYIVKMATDIRDMISARAYAPPLELIERHASEGVQLFYDEQKMVDDFCFEDDWHRRDRVIASFRNIDVDRFNGIVRHRYWQGRGNDKPGQFEVGDGVIFQAPNVSDSGFVLHNNGDFAVVKACKRIWSEPLKLWYWRCKDRADTPFMVVDSGSVSVFQQKLKKLSSLARAEQDTALKKKYWRTFFLLKNQFAEVDYRYAMTIHKLQGSTYETVFLNLSDLFVRSKDLDMFYRLLYVAITRASKHVKILMPPQTRPNSQKKSISELERSLLEIGDIL